VIAEVLGPEYLPSRKSDWDSIFLRKTCSSVPILCLTTPQELINLPQRLQILASANRILLRTRSSSDISSWKQMARELVESMDSGSWLVVSFTPVTESSVQTINDILSFVFFRKSIHKDFRLWLTVDDLSSIPPRTAQNCFKLRIHNNINDGVYDAALELAQTLKDEYLQAGRGKTDLEAGRFFLSLCIFHAILHERAKHAGGWFSGQTVYEDFESAARSLYNGLQSTIVQGLQVEWRQIRSLIAIEYEGQAGSGSDARILAAIMNRCFHRGILNPKHEILPGLSIASCSSASSMVKGLRSMAGKSKVELLWLDPQQSLRDVLQLDDELLSLVFAIHHFESPASSDPAEGDVTPIFSTPKSVSPAAPKLSRKELSRQPSFLQTADKGKKVAPPQASHLPEIQLPVRDRSDLECKLIALVKGTLEQLSSPIEGSLLEQATAGDEVLKQHLRQEVDAYNALISFLRQSLTSTLGALLGAVGMQREEEKSEQDILLRHLQNESTPAEWQQRSWRVRKLDAWMQLLRSAHLQLQSWCQLGYCKCYSLAPLLFPQAFFAALKTSIFRKCILTSVEAVPIEEARVHLVPTKKMSTDEISDNIASLGTTAFVRGIELLGAALELPRLVLSDSSSMTNLLPILQVRNVRMSSTTADLSYECPCFTLGRWTRPVRLGKAKPADLPEPELSGDPRVSDSGGFIGVHVVLPLENSSDVQRWVLRGIRAQLVQQGEVEDGVGN